MKYNYDDTSLRLNIDLDEEIDMNTCRVLRTLIDGYIIRYQPKECVIDLKNVNFMDSSGIGLLLGRYNLIKLLDSKLVIANPSNNIRRIIELSSISKDIRMRG